jgi:hypothetical protein
VQRGRLGEERYFLVVPVDEDTTWRREDVGGASLRERNDFFEFWRREREREGERRTLRRCPVLSTSMVKNSSVEENVDRS